MKWLKLFPITQARYKRTNKFNPFLFLVDSSCYVLIIALIIIVLREHKIYL